LVFPSKRFVKKPIIYLILIIKYIRVSWFGSSVQTFCKKTHYNFLNQHAIQIFSQSLGHGLGLRQSVPCRAQRHSRLQRDSQGGSRTERNLPPVQGRRSSSACGAGCGRRACGRWGAVRPRWRGRARTDRGGGNRHARKERDVRRGRAFIRAR
jgi:hypothetical protein